MTGYVLQEHERAAIRRYEQQKGVWEELSRKVREKRRSIRMAILRSMPEQCDRCRIASDELKPVRNEYEEDREVEYVHVPGCLIRGDELV